MADAKVSKTFDLNGRVGSTPTFGTNYLVRLGYFNNQMVIGAASNVLN